MTEQNAQPCPTMSIQEVADFFGISYETARKAVNANEVAGTLAPIGKTRRVNRRIFMEAYDPPTQPQRPEVGEVVDAWSPDRTQAAQ